MARFLARVVGGLLLLPLVPLFMLEHLWIKYGDRFNFVVGPHRHRAKPLRALSDAVSRRKANKEKQNDHHRSPQNPHR